MVSSSGLRSEDPHERAAAAATAGLAGGDPTAVSELAALVERDPDPKVRVAALGALARIASANEPTPTVGFSTEAFGRRRFATSGIAVGAWHIALGDDEPTVRRRAAEAAPRIVGVADPEGRTVMATTLADRLDDDVPLVAEAAAFALGEIAAHVDVGPVVPRLAETAGSHPDALVREAAVAALGAIGDDAGLPAILGALRDRPAIRRRAVLALAPFEGPEVDEALHAASADRDWRVRQAAEDLLA